MLTPVWTNSGCFVVDDDDGSYLTFMNYRYERWKLLGKTRSDVESLLGASGFGFIKWGPVQSAIVQKGDVVIDGREHPIKVRGVFVVVELPEVVSPSSFARVLRVYDNVTGIGHEFLPVSSLRRMPFTL